MYVQCGIRPSIKYCTILIGCGVHSTIITIFVFIFSRIAFSIDYWSLSSRTIRAQTVRMTLPLYYENDRPLYATAKKQNYIRRARCGFSFIFGSCCLIYEIYSVSKQPTILTRQTITIQNPNSRMKMKRTKRNTEHWQCPKISINVVQMIVMSSSNKSFQFLFFTMRFSNFLSVTCGIHKKVVESTA